MEVTLYQAAQMAPKLKGASNYQAWSDYLIYTLSKHFPDAYQVLTERLPHPGSVVYASVEPGAIKAYLAEKLGTQTSMISTEDVNLEVATRDKQNKIKQAQYEIDLTQWMDADSAACDLIVMTCGEGPQQAIIHADSSHQMWHDLAELYDGNPKVFIHKFQTLLRYIRGVETFPAWLERYYFLRAIGHVRRLAPFIGTLSVGARQIRMDRMYSDFVELELQRQ